MKSEKLYKLIKAVVLVIVFIISIIVISKITNKGNTGTTAQMGEAMFPLVYTTVDGYKVNCMHGYANDMEENYIRDSITPLPEDRNLAIEVDKYGATINKITYEVRSMDTTRLVEKTDVTDYKDLGKSIEATLNIKDLIDKDTEYNLTIILQTETNEEIRYYTRIVQSDDLYAKEKMDFVTDFHNKTFDKEKAKDLVKYLESNSSGDNSDFQHVDIHSNFNQVTWGNLEVTQITDPLISLKDIYKETASIELTYQVKAPNAYGEAEYYNVREIFYIRYTTSRIYLLNYERTMDQIFNPQNNVYSGNKINLGITPDAVKYGENKNGNVVAFVQEGSLYCYNNASGKLATVYSFSGKDVTDLRNSYNQHDIRIIDIDENGNIRFMVFGYMNRGKHEGTVGTAVYYYDAGINSIEEEVFIKSAKPYSLLKEEVEELCYSSGTQKLYIMLDNTIYKIDLTSRESTVIETNLTKSNYVIKDGFIAWLGSNETGQSKIITILNLETGLQRQITAQQGQFVRPIGFIDDDFIYGVANEADVYYDLTGQLQYPMFSINIEDSSGNLLKTYSQPGIYIMDTTVDENLVNLTRATKVDGTNTYQSIENDQIVNNSVETGKMTTLASSVTDLKETEWQLVLTNNITDTTPKILSPNEELYEESREIELTSPQNSQTTTNYYVYGMGELLNTYTNPKEAIIDAYNNFGVVVDDNQSYIWERIKKQTRTQIADMELTGTAAKSSSLGACLTTILQHEGNNADVLADLANKMSAMDILQKNLSQKVLDLTGCSLDQVLYYVSVGKPVLAIIDGNTSVIIVGYDEYNTTLYNPITGETYKMGLNDSKAWFEGVGNVFVSYVETGDSAGQ